MTYRNLAPWIPLDEFLLAPMGRRMKYVRTNLGPAKPKPGRRTRYLTHDEFAAAVGAKSRDRPIAWEKGQAPRDYAEEIAKLTPYPAEAFGAAGAEELFEVTIGGTLRSLRDEADGARLVLRAVLEALATNGIRVQLDEAATGFLATPESGGPGNGGR